MWSPLYSVILALLLVAVAFVVVVFSPIVRLLIRRWRRPHGQVALTSDVRRCRCGYELAGLSLPRCPECGRAIGFDKSFEELGLTEEELQRLREKANALSPAPPPPVPSDVIDASPTTSRVSRP